MGGLISLFAFFARPDAFGVAGSLSPSLWFAERAIFGRLEPAPFHPGRIYLDVGRLEGAETLADARRMRDLLQAKGYRARPAAPLRGRSRGQARGGGLEQAVPDRAAVSSSFFRVIRAPRVPPLA